MPTITYHNGTNTRFHSQAEQRLYQDFMLAVRRIRESIPLDELEQLVATGNLDEIMRRVGGIGATVAASSAAVFVLSGENVVSFIRDNLGVNVVFDQVNERAVGLLRANRLDLISNLDGNTRAAVRSELLESSIRGINPRDTARRIRETVGLNPRLQEAVSNYRRLLTAGQRGRPSAQVLDRLARDKRFDRTIISSIERDVALSPERVDRMVERYQAKLVQHRAEKITRTETLKALNQGSHEAFSQMYDEGVINPNEVVRTWFTAGDNRVRDPHAFAHGQERRQGEPFLVNGELLQYPGDPSASAGNRINCRCSEITEIRVTSRNVVDTGPIQ